MIKINLSNGIIYFAKYFSPIRIDSIDGKNKIVELSLGYFHSAALTEG